MPNLANLELCAALTHHIKDIANGGLRDEVVCGGPREPVFQKIDMDVQLFWGFNIFPFFYFGGSENQNFQIKSKLRSLLSPYLD